MEMRSALGRVRHLGSARSGTEHFIQQRVTSVALVPLAFWFVISVLSLVGAGVDHDTIKAWFQVHGNLVMYVLFIGVVFYHTWLGLEMVITDYVQSKWLEITMLIGVKMLAYLLATSCIIAGLKLGLGG